MSILDENTIDVISEVQSTGNLRLTIADHLDWDYPDHLYLLQEKVNCYISFIDSEQYKEGYPTYSKSDIFIHTRFKYTPTKQAIVFLAQLSEILLSMGVRFEYEVFEG